MTNLSLESARDAFLRQLAGKNRAANTLVAYATDLDQFIAWLRETNLAAQTPADVTKADIAEYLAALGERKLSGVSRARKLAAIRELFRYLEGEGLVAKSPATGVDTPKKEKNGRAWLRPDEYSRMLSLAGGNVRDFCILTVFLQTGIRVGELCALRLDDVDMRGKVLKVRAGKGMVAREVELETKGMRALKNWLAVRRTDVGHDHVFTNERDGGPISERGVRMLVTKYREQAGITKQASCHSLRHTFATIKAEKGMSPYQLQRLLGHAKLDTTMVYVHIGRSNAAAVMEKTSL